MRRTVFNIKSIVIGLIIINVFIFFITQFNTFSVPQRLLDNLIMKGKSHVAYAVQRYGLFISLFSLFPLMIKEMGWAWQFLSYLFLHGSIFHLFFNMYALFLFGRPLEEKWGWKEFAFFYLATGIGAGIVTFFWNLARNPYIPTIGASGAIFGIVLAFGLEFPDTILLLFFIIPIRAKYAAFIFGGIELVMILTGTMQGIGHFTHLAGLFFGYVYYVLRIRRSYMRGWSKLSKRVASLRTQRRKGVSLARKTVMVQKALQIKEKMARGDALNSRETSFLRQMRDAYSKNKDVICVTDEFNITSEFCQKCDDFYACLYRFIVEQL